MNKKVALTRLLASVMKPASQHDGLSASPRAVFVLLILFLILPGHPLSFIDGLPWGPLALSCAVLLGLGVFAAWPLADSRWPRSLALAALTLATLKLLLALVAPRYGLEASYYANERFNGLPEGSTQSPRTTYTRIDSSLDFGSDEFPLYFFNDSERFNSTGPDRLDRGRALTWSARWSGYLNAATDKTIGIWLTASGPAELSLDGRPLLKVDADGRATAEARVHLTRGAHQLEVGYVRKRERSGYLQVTTDLGGQRAILGTPLLTPSPYPSEHLGFDRVAAVAARGVDVAFLALLATTLGLTLATALSAARSGPGQSRSLALERPLLALVPLAFFLHAALPGLHRFEKMAFLGGGQDWLTHETLARDIQFNGPLMTLGKPLGQGALFYAQPLYPYYLALLHAISGEDLFGVTALQMLGLGVAVVLVYELARRLFDRPTAIAALILMLAVLVPFELAWVARLLISEALYIWLMPAAILALLALVREPRFDFAGLQHASLSPSTLRAILAGALLGMACLTRGPTLLYLPPAALLVWLSLRRFLPAREVVRSLTTMVLSAGVLISLVPVRNAIVAGKPVLTASSSGVNLEKLHRPSDAVRFSRIDDDPLHRMISVDRPTREVIEYLRQDPVGYFGSYLPLAAYTLGVGSALNHLLDERPVQLHPDLLILNLLYLLAVLLVPGARSRESAFLHLFIALHFLTMVVFAPYDYENRLVLPMYVFVIVFAAAAVARIVRLGLRNSALGKTIHRSGRQPLLGGMSSPLTASSTSPSQSNQLGSRR